MNLSSILNDLVNGLENSPPFTTTIIPNNDDVSSYWIDLYESFSYKSYAWIIVIIHQSRTPPTPSLRQCEEATITTPQKPMLFKHVATYLQNHILIKVNEQGMIMKGDNHVLVNIPDIIHN